MSSFSCAGKVDISLRVIFFGDVSQRDRMERKWDLPWGTGKRNKLHLTRAYFLPPLLCL